MLYYMNMTMNININETNELSENNNSNVNDTSLTIRSLRQLCISKYITEDETIYACRIWQETEALSNNPSVRLLRFKQKLTEIIGVQRTEMIILMLHRISVTISNRLNKNNNEKKITNEISSSLIDKTINFLVISNRLNLEQAETCKENWKLTKSSSMISNYNEIFDRISLFTLHNKYQINHDLSNRIHQFVISVFNKFFEKYESHSITDNVNQTISVN